MNKMLYITVALIGLPLYGMEQAKPAAQAQAATKTPSEEQITAYVWSVCKGDINEVGAFLREFPLSIDAHTAGTIICGSVVGARTALFEAMEHCLHAQTNLSNNDWSYRMFAYLLLMGANTQIHYRDKSIIEFLTGGCTYIPQGELGKYHKPEHWEGHAGIEECAQKLLKILELAEKNNLRVQEEAKKASVAQPGIRVVSVEQVGAFVEKALQEYAVVKAQRDAKKQREKEAKEKAIAMVISYQEKLSDMVSLEQAEMLLETAFQECLTKAKAQKEAKEKAVALAMFQQKRQADRKAKEEAKAAGNSDKN